MIVEIINDCDATMIHFSVGFLTGWLLSSEGLDL